ncbi:MAG: FAD-dependent oxidoreductase [Hyphomonadaceae bacterium]
MKIAVIGLGIAGLSACAELARRGHAVEGFEQFDLMHAFGSSHGDTRIFRLTPGEGDIYVRMAARAREGWRRWEEIGAAPLIDWTGGMMAGPSDSTFVRSCIQLGERYGHAHRVMTGAEANAETGGAFAFPRDWLVCRQEDCGPTFADRTRAFLIKHAHELGAALHDGVKIDAIRSGALLIEGEARAFDRVIVSAGAWGAQLLPEFAQHLTVRRKVIAWLDAPARLPVICVDNDVGLYGMTAPEGRYKVGLHSVGETVGADAVRDASEADAIEVFEAVRTLLPGLSSPRRWARCLYTMTPDEHFLMAPSHEHANTLFFSACSGHGFKYAPVLGEIAADWAEGKAREELDAFGLANRSAMMTPLGARAQ